MERVPVRLQGGVAAIDRQGVLEEVVGAEAGERDPVEPLGPGQDGRRDLQHHPEADLAPFQALGVERCSSLLGEAQEGAGIAAVGDHRSHDLDRPEGRRTVGGPELGHEQVGPRHRQPKGPNAEERVVLVGQGQVRDRLVATDIEQSDRHRPATERLDRPGSFASPAAASMSEP